MKRAQQITGGFFAAAAMMMLILDRKTGLQGATEGIELCLYTVIPSLFPFIVLSAYIRGTFAGKRIRLLRSVSQWCKIPVGSETLMLLGFLGGYPVGAEMVRQAYEDNFLGKEDAERMLGFSNNAGPAFIFGMTWSLFESPYVPWVLWILQILSAFLVGHLLPGGSKEPMRQSESHGESFQHSLVRAVRVTTMICAWIILFRIIISFCHKWFLWILPPLTGNIVSGFLELANGCIELASVPTESMRFLLCCTFLSFGGICVTMQTISVVKGLSIRTALVGKFLQCMICIVLSYPLQTILFRQETVPPLPALGAGVCILGIVLAERLSGLKKV